MRVSEGIARNVGGSWHGMLRLVVHGIAGWALCTIAMLCLLRVTSLTGAMIAHALIAPTIFAVIARHYFAAGDAREPLMTAVAFVGILALLDLVVVAVMIGVGFAMFGSFLGFWLPVISIFIVTAAVGTISSN